MPLCFTPPKGMRGSDFTVPLTKTMPDSMRVAISSARARFRVQTLAPRPNSESLASRIAASRPATATTGATGPNVSSRRTRMSFVTRSEEHTSELQSRFDLVCRLLPEKKNTRILLSVVHHHKIVVPHDTGLELGR